MTSSSWIYVKFHNYTRKFWLKLQNKQILDTLQSLHTLWHQ